MREILFVCFLVKATCKVYVRLFMYYNTETEVADQTYCLTYSSYTDNVQITYSIDTIMPDIWQGYN